MKRLVLAAAALLFAFAVAPMARADEIDDAFKMFKADDGLTAAEKIPALKAFIEARQNDPKVLPLVSLLGVLAEEAGDKVADKWGTAIFDRLRDKLDAASASKDAENAVVSVPVANAKTKTVTLPGGATMEMIYCPPGTYMMGRRKDSPCKESHDVCPQIKVTLTKGFWLGKYEVTQAQWKSVMGKNPSDSESFGDDLPVNNMSWDDAVAFVKKVGNGARLPTDAEWEYACKAGTDTVFHWGDTCNGTEANCNGTKPFGTEKKGPNIGHAVKVGSYRPNAWGFHDMAGNVAEWCNDRHADYYLVHPEELTDPKGGDSTVRYRTVRGGCFYTYFTAECSRSVRRDMLPPDWPKPFVGFRMAMDE